MSETINWALLEHFESEAEQFAYLPEPTKRAAEALAKIDYVYFVHGVVGVTATGRGALNHHMKQKQADEVAALKSELAQRDAACKRYHAALLDIENIVSLPTTDAVMLLMIRNKVSNAVRDALKGSAK